MSCITTYSKKVCETSVQPLLDSPTSSSRSREKKTYRLFSNSTLWEKEENMQLKQIIHDQLPPCLQDEVVYEVVLHHAGLEAEPTPPSPCAGSTIQRPANSLILQYLMLSQLPPFHHGLSLLQ